MSKSDKDAVQAYIHYLEKTGEFINVERVKSPADIRAYKEGEETPYYFEVKMTQKPDKYFGAATETEWAQALEDPSHYIFVVVRDYGNNRDFSFKEYTLDEFRQFCSIPPFKIYFNIDLNAQHAITYKVEEGTTKESIINRKEGSKRLNESLSLSIDNHKTVFSEIHKVFIKQRKEHPGK